MVILTSRLQISPYFCVDQERVRECSKERSGMRVKTVREGFTPCKTDFEQKTETDCFAVYLTLRLVDNLPLISYTG